MPRYFFHTTADDDRTELPGDAAARKQARKTFGMMIRDGDLPDGGQMTVMDETGRTVIRLSFSAQP